MRKAALALAVLVLGAVNAAAWYPLVNGVIRHSHVNANDGGTIPRWQYLVTFSSGATITGPFVSSGTTVYPAGSTITIGGFSNTYVMVSSGDLVGVFGATITLPSVVAVSSQSCYMDGIGIATNTVNIHGSFGGVAGSAYITSQRASNIATAATAAGSVTGRNLFPFLYDGDVVGSAPPLANTPWRFRFSWESAPNNTILYESVGQCTNATSPTAFSSTRSEIQGQYTAASAETNKVSQIFLRTNNVPVVNNAANTWPIDMHYEIWCKGFHHQ